MMPKKKSVRVPNAKKREKSRADIRTIYVVACKFLKGANSRNSRRQKAKSLAAIRTIYAVVFQ